MTSVRLARLAATTPPPARFVLVRTASVPHSDASSSSSASPARSRPKSVVASQTGLFFAQNMMYRHSITVYDRRFRLLKTIDDAVDLGRHGHRELGRARGAPVEAAFTPDGAYAYVSNYSMYGAGFGREGRDSVYARFRRPNAASSTGCDTKRLRIDRAIRVGAVPKFVAVTPDGARRPGVQLVLVRSQRHQHPTAAPGRADTARPLPARHRDRLAEPLRLRRAHGHERHRSRQPQNEAGCAGSETSARARATSCSARATTSSM